MKLTSVVHVNDPASFDLYVGRRTPRAKNPAAHVGHPLANPYPLPPKPTPRQREVSLLLYRGGLDSPLRHFDDDDFASLAGLRLSCWCVEVGQVLTALDPHICHAQIVAERADRAIGTIP